MATKRAKKSDKPTATLPVHLFLGNSLLTHPAARRRIAEILPEDRRETDLEIVRIPEKSLPSVIDAVSQVGMFGGGRCIWIQGLGGESAEEAESFRKELEKSGLPDGYAIVATSSVLDLRSKLAKWFRECGTLTDLRIETDRKGNLDENSVRRIAAQRLEEAGLQRPDAAALEAIVRRAGSDAGQFMAEVDKLALAGLAVGRLTPELVAENMRDLGTAWVFDLTDAIGRKRFNEARVLLDGLLASGSEPLMILGALAENVGTMIAARPVVDGLAPGALRNGKQFVNQTFPQLPEAARAGFRNNGWKAYFSLVAASAFEARELRRLHGALAEADLRMKSSSAEPANLLFSFLVEACRNRRSNNSQVS